MFVYMNQQLSVGTFDVIGVLVCELVVYSKLLMFAITWRKIYEERKKTQSKSIWRKEATKKRQSN